MIATIVNNRITASVSGSSIAASVVASNITASASGGVGPAGTTVAGTLSQVSDVLITSIADGDVIRYSSSTQKWLNTNEKNLRFDGGNF
jgi:hypothetical protein